MNMLLLAVQFLTVIPLKIKDADERRIAESVIYFPLAGLLIGLVLSGIYYCLTMLNLPLLTESIILVVSLIALTGGMHLDGLSDTADAFLSSKPRDEMLAIMRDPHVGVMGVLSLISLILLKVGLLYSINGPLKVIALLLICVLSRWAVVPVMFLFPYARRDGKAGIFIRGMTLKIFILSAIAGIICSFLIWQVKGLVALLTIAVLAYETGRFTSRRIGGITGDTLGATIELAEVAVLLMVCISQGASYG